MIDLSTNETTLLVIGQQGENEAETFDFDFSSFVEEFGSGTITLAVQRPHDDNPYPVNLTVNGTTATWTVSDSDTQYEGRGRVQITYTVDEVIKKSVAFKTKILPSVIPTGTVVPDPIQTYLDQMIAIHSDVMDIGDRVTELENVVAGFEDTVQDAEDEINNLVTTQETAITNHANDEKDGISTYVDNKMLEVDAEVETAKAEVRSLYTVTDANNDGNITIGG